MKLKVFKIAAQQDNGRYGIDMTNLQNLNVYGYAMLIFLRKVYD